MIQGSSILLACWCTFFILFSLDARAFWPYFNPDEGAEFVDVTDDLHFTYTVDDLVITNTTQSHAHCMLAKLPPPDYKEKKGTVYHKKSTNRFSTTHGQLIIAIPAWQEYRVNPTLLKTVATIQCAAVDPL